MDGKTEKTLMCVDLVELDGRVLKKMGILDIVSHKIPPGTKESHFIYLVKNGSNSKSITRAIWIKSRTSI